MKKKLFQNSHPTGSLVGAWIKNDTLPKFAARVLPTSIFSAVSIHKKKIARR